MIVVVGQPYLVEAEPSPRLDGAPARIAVAAAERGRPVQLVGTAGEDHAGDEVAFALARAGVGHVALLRKAGQRTLRRRPIVEIDADPVGEDPGEGPRPDVPPPLDAGDVELALRYLPDTHVLVLAEPASRETTAVVVQAARWSDARLIVVAAAGDGAPSDLPGDAIVFEAPPTDPDGVFAQMVGAFAAALDQGDEPGDAFRATVTSVGWAPSEG